MVNATIMTHNIHIEYMQRALQLAERGRCTVSPNPLVGCVLVKNNHIIASGWHQKAGEPHAEIIALDQIGDDAKGATAYITLEPCCHTGRTPPCVDALIKAGVQMVYVACLDLNPLVHGEGIARLQAAGIETHVGLCEQEALQQNRIFFHYISKKTPFVIAKWAMSLDGKTTVTPGDHPRLSSDASLQEAHALRQTVDAVLIGAKTALLDNPLLTVRYQTTIYKQPIRIVLMGQEPLPEHLHLFDADLPGETWMIIPETIDLTWRAARMKKNVQMMPCKTGPDGRIHLPTLMHLLGEKNITSLLIEGGMTVQNAFFAHDLVHETHVFLTPFLINTLPTKQALTVTEMQRLGPDYYFIARHGVSHV